MINNEEMLIKNKKNYEDLYSRKQAFLRYPADWIIRFHNMYLKEHMPSGRVLDYGCGGGNNSLFFIEQGYDTWGIDVSEPAIDLVKINLQNRKYNSDLAKRFSVIPPENITLPFKNDFFDIIISNQALYYLPSEEHIKQLCADFSRCLKPGGIVFFTMMGPKNYYITHHAKQIHNGRIYEVKIDDPKHRLYGVSELIYVVRDEDELCKLFSRFDVLSIGYFDQSMFDALSNFHWIFIGKNNPKI